MSKDVAWQVTRTSVGTQSRYPDKLFGLILDAQACKRPYKEAFNVPVCHTVIHEHMNLLVRSAVLCKVPPTHSTEQILLQGPETLAGFAEKFPSSMGRQET